MRWLPPWAHTFPPTDSQAGCCARGSAFAPPWACCWLPLAKGRQRPVPEEALCPSPPLPHGAERPSHGGVRRGGGPGHGPVGLLPGPGSLGAASSAACRPARAADPPSFACRAALGKRCPRGRRLTAAGRDAPGTPRYRHALKIRRGLFLNCPMVGAPCSLVTLWFHLLGLWPRSLVGVRPSLTAGGLREGGCD